PPTAKSLCTKSGRAGAAGRVKHKIPRLRCHCDTPRDDLGIRPNHVVLAAGEACDSCVEPEVAERVSSEVLEIPDVTECVSDRDKPICYAKPLHAFPFGFPRG